MEKLEKFARLGLSENMLRALKNKGFEEPTPIQEKIIPALLENNRDLVGQAQTGTGKTAAFAIPILERIEDKSKHIQVLVLTPTRELAIQVSEEFNSLKGKRRLHVLPIYGGQSIELQLSRLRAGVEAVVGTPGRILDHIRRRSIDLSQVSYVVLDEADEMLNMGFIEDVEIILAATGETHTTLLFSATMPREIVSVAKKYMKNYELIAIQSDQETTDLTDQIYFEVLHRDKFEALCRIIDIEPEFYGLVFCRTRVDVDSIAGHLNDRGYDAGALHGDISQGQRLKILEAFKKQRTKILVATDVAARGIDINNLTHVINYALPQDAGAYVHRIGRTGRAGREGTAITFITPDEYRKLMYIKKATKTDIRKEKLPQIDEIMSAKRARIKESIDALAATELSSHFRSMALEMLTENSPEVVVAALLQHTFQDEFDHSNYNEIRDVQPRIGGKTRLHIGLGKKDRMSKRRLVEFIENKAKVDQRRIDNVQVFETSSFVTVPFRDAERILQVFQSTRRGKQALVKIAGPQKTNGRTGKGKGKKRFS